MFFFSFPPISLSLWIFFFPRPLLCFSPINDILDKESYTLEELLGETELIQEVKSGNQRLLQL